MFDVDEFVAGCEGALAEPQPVRAVKDVLERVLADAESVTRALQPAPGVALLHRSDALTVATVVVPPGLPRSLPHDHRMWALVGILGGQEDNAFFRRAEGGLEPSGGRSLRAHDVLAMGDDTIHSIGNPSGHEMLAAIHIYGGDLVGVARSMWTEPDHTERPYDDAQVLGFRIRT